MATETDTSTTDAQRGEDVSFWKVTKHKLLQLGWPGIVVGIIWVVGLYVWYDWAVGAYREQVPEAGQILLGILIVWFLLGVAIYAWRDPHGARAALVRRINER